MSIARFFVTGRLTKDAVLSYLKNGTPALSFSVASEYSKKVNGKWEKETSFFYVSLFGKSAESRQKYLLKGVHVSVSGDLRQDRWEKNGQKESRIVLYADTDGIDISGGGKKEGGSSFVEKTDTQQQPSIDNFQEDIPFA